MNGRRISAFCFVLWLIVIFVLLLLPGGYLNKRSGSLINIPHFDKVVHFCLFGGYCFLMYWFVRLRSVAKRGRLMIICLLFTAAFGLLGELLQLWTNQWLNRTFTWSDLVADTLGGVVALAFLYFTEKKIETFLARLEKK